MAAATATPKKMTYEFTVDDDELSEGKPSTDQGTMCNFYKLNLPASASILSKQIAKSQAKRAKKEERHRRRVDLSTVREQDETKGSNSEEHSQNVSPRPVAASGIITDDVVSLPGSAPPSQYEGRSRIDSAPLDVKLQRQASLPDDQRKAEPMDEEEAELLAMLLSGIERNERRMMVLNENGNQVISNQQPNHQILSSPGLPRIPPTAKVSEWLLERSSSPDNLSVVSSVFLEDSGLVLNYQNSDDGDDEIFFDAQEEKVEEDVVNCVEHEMKGLSLNRNMTAMTQSLVRVEEETTTDCGHDIMSGERVGRSTSVSPRPSNDQFVRNTNGSATFNVKHSSTLASVQKLTPRLINGNSLTNIISSSKTPLTSRTTRSVLRVHNVNSVARPPLQNFTPMSKSSVLTNQTNRRAVSVARLPEMSHTQSSNSVILQQKSAPPPVTANTSTTSRPASVASSIDMRFGVTPINVTSTTASNLEGLQDLIQMQEEALRRAALDGHCSSTERKMSWHSDQDANRQSTSTNSSLGSLSSSKSIDGAHALSKLATPSRIPALRSRLPTTRGSNLPKRVHSVAAAVRLTSSKPESSSFTNGSGANLPDNVDECF